MPLKLLVDAHTFDENHQGIRTFLKGIYGTDAVNSSNNLMIYLASHNIDNLKKEFKDQSNFKFIKLKFRNKYIRLLYELPKIIAEHSFDYIHFNYYLPFFLNRKCKYIVTIHDVLFIDFPKYFPVKYRLINSFLFKRSARKADFLTTVSKYSADRIKENFNLGNKKITVLPNAIGESFKVLRNKRDDRDYIKKKYGIDEFIIYVSRIELRKNHFRLIKAYQKLKLWQNNIHLVLIGKRSFKDNKLDCLIEEVNSESKGGVIEFNNVSNDELVVFYNAARLAIFPSLCEGFGIPPIESGALQTPTICSNSSAMKDFSFFEDNLFDARDEKNIRLKIKEVIKRENDTVFLKKVSDKIREKYNWENTANRLLNLILNDK
ncbi:glycosyltransferase family 1 protein [Winogradskyella sp. KYW1333]|uniref:glycosyltransferase family 4 protein n=1 Tax=unclassified Winogradskyella TaxID=2615021 RepID=UPI000DF43E7A|nr:glycosyltransferase family 1 protein [Winogradskyella sp. KYW1333]RCT53655.1 glycosyltransferase family 1 protein [Winogradskyella sp. KYW1333]